MENALSEYDRWETRYRAPEYIFGTQPNYFLASCKALLPKSGNPPDLTSGAPRISMRTTPKNSVCA